jgi:hypothetical protein
METYTSGSGSWRPLSRGSAWLSVECVSAERAVVAFATVRLAADIAADHWQRSDERTDVTPIIEARSDTEPAESHSETVEAAVSIALVMASNRERVTVM